jgi:hypothetical protein
MLELACSFKEFPMRASRLIAPLVFALTAGIAIAADQPKNLQPLPEVPPPPPGVALDEDLQPQVTITRRGEDKVEEYRLNGRLYMLKVTPAQGGVPYYLVDDEGKGTWARRDGIGPNVRPPMWVIKSW